MKTNKYPARCATCRVQVPANGGTLTKRGRRWIVNHLDCKAAGAPRVMVTRFSSGAEVYQNVGGRCIDAPCCGCCS